MPTERASYAPGVTVNRITDLSSLPEKDRTNVDRMADKAKSLGAEVWFVLGDTRPGRKNAEGKTIRTYGTTYFDGSGRPIIVVSLDSKRYLPSALFSHELIHVIQIQSGGTSVETILSGISEESIADVEEALTDLASPYNKSYSGSFGGEFNENNRLYYWEEVLGDIYAGINRLGFTDEDFFELRDRATPLIAAESAKYENADGVKRSVKPARVEKYFIGNVKGHGAMAVVTPDDITPGSQYEGAAYAYINALRSMPLGDRQPFLAKTLDGATVVRLHPRTAGEYTGSPSTQKLGKNEKAAKMLAATVLDDMVLLGENGTFKNDRMVDGNTNKHGDFAANGWTYLDTKFAVARETDTGVVYDLYSGSINIGNA